MYLEASITQTEITVTDERGNPHQPTTAELAALQAIALYLRK